ncbi:MAG TPA: hypothetical protein VH988_00340 [Thermoanaerobaculia bacterium]|nr:hypothetical protein [Thermoanaerobaculia bacterium]
MKPGDGSAADVARGVLKDTLRQGPVSLDEIGRRLGHTRGYMSRALRGVNPLTIDTITGALEVAGIEPSEYFAAVAKALAPPVADDAGPSQAKIEETVLRTLRRLGWAPPGDDERKSGSETR